MRKYILISLFFLIPVSFAQSPVDKVTARLKSAIESNPSSERTLVWVYFSDKGSNLGTYFNQPSLVVSEKSLKRRAKVKEQGALIKFNDLPVNADYIGQLESIGFLVKQKSKWFNSVSGYATKEIINQISRLENVKKIDLVIKFSKEYETIVKTAMKESFHQ